MKFHERAVARIGDRVVETATVPTDSPFNVHQVTDARFGPPEAFEMIHYDEGIEDGGMMRAIAGADSGNILIRLEGRSGQRDFRLTPLSRRFIRDCVRLADLIKKVRTEA